jgi:hypothetical protein
MMITVKNWVLNRKNTKKHNPATALARIAAMMVILLLTLAACQSQPTYQGYSGPAKPAAEEARVYIPAKFNLLNVDGNSYTQPLMGNETVVKLLPGDHKIVIKYVDFWSVNADTDDRVASQPMLVAFNAKAGEKYRIQSQELKDIKAAKAFAKNPKVDIISVSSNSSVATDIKYQLEDKGLIAAFIDSLSPNDTPEPAVTEATAAEAAAAQPPSSKGEPALEMLKYWWQKADAQQQEDFMKWIVEK